MLPMLKGSKHDYAYQEGPGIPPRCDKCQYFVEGGRCLLVKGKISGINGSCNFWVSGVPQKEENLYPAKFSKEQSGYVENPKGPRCGICIFYRNPRLCRLVSGDIDPQIGCCSAWKK